MPGLWRNQDGTRKHKYLVQRRDGTVPEAPYFVLLAADPAAVAALNAYADAAHEWRMDPEYIADVRTLADEFSQWIRTDWDARRGDPEAPPHRTDDPEIIAKMRGSDG